MIPVFIIIIKYEILSIHIFYSVIRSIIVFGIIHANNTNFSPNNYF